MHFWLQWASAAIWIAFIFYWSAAAGTQVAERISDSDATEEKQKRRPWISIQIRRKEAGSGDNASVARESAGSRQVHQLLMWSAILIALLPGYSVLARPWTTATSAVGFAGLAVQVASSAFYVWAKRHLGQYWSARIATRADHRIVRTGPYRWLRHPMYTAILGMFAGTAMVSGKFHGLVGLAIGMIAYGRKIRLEERHLRDQMGAEYEAYRKETWALVPGIF